MNTLKKGIIAIATIATIAGTTVSTAHAGSKWFKKGLAQGVGVGVGLGIVGALAQPRTRTVVVQQQPVYQPRCYWQAQTLYGPYGPYTQNVQICQ